MINVKLKYKQIYEKLLILLLGLSPIIDSLNGFLMESYSVSIGLIYRAFGLLIILFYTYNKNNVKNVIYISIIIFYFGFIALAYSLNHNSLSGLLNELSTASKLVFIIAIVESFKNVIKDKNYQRKVVNKIIKLNLILFPLCVLVPAILGIGFNVYHGAGNKGFFNANNELGIVLSALFIIALDNLYIKLNIKNFVIFILIVFSMISIGSKIGLIFPAIAIAIYFIKGIVKINTKYKFITMIVICTLLIGIGINVFFRDMLEKILNRQAWLYQNVESSLIFLILSGRNILLKIVHQDLVESPILLIRLLVGYGVYMKEKVISLGYGSSNLKPVEMDLFDTFYSYGIIGIILIYGYFMRILFKYGKLSNENFKYTLAYITILILGFLSGHVFWGAMSASMLGIIICGMIANKD